MKETLIQCFIGDNNFSRRPFQQHDELILAKRGKLFQYGNSFELQSNLEIMKKTNNEASQ
jgi:hypothetical protein